MENVKQILFVNACMRGPERSRNLEAVPDPF